ncbi:MAG: hypothetical protein M1480_14480 [Bacteroidetes bacterium]|nr:hypothetical protein [Bacteroidota bacterium]
MKKYLSIMLIFLIALNSFGFYLVFGYLYLNCKIESGIAIDKINKKHSGELTLFILDNHSESGWLNDDELIVNNHHYDVVKKETISDKIYVYCLKDEKEDKVSNEFYSLNNIYDNNPSHSKNISDLLLDKLIKNFLSPHLFYFNYHSLSYSSSCIDNISYKVPFKNVLSPPPEKQII